MKSIILAGIAALTITSAAFAATKYDPESPPFAIAIDKAVKADIVKHPAVDTTTDVYIRDSDVRYNPWMGDGSQ